MPPEVNAPKEKLLSQFVLAALGSVLALIVYWRAIATYFAQDDITFLTRATEPLDWNRLVRPLSETLAFRIEYWAFGLNPLGYHVVNLSLHLMGVVLVYMVSLSLGGRRSTAAMAAILFGASSIAFTPLHWATGVIDLLANVLLMAGTWLWIESHHRGSIWSWLGAIVGFAAMLSKETAVVWPLPIAVIEWRSGRDGVLRNILPAVAASVVFLLIFLSSGQTQRLDATAYERSGSPLFLIQNLSTYLRWNAALHEPIRDVLAAADPTAWRAAAPLALALGMLVWRARNSKLVIIGAAWWLTFLLPVLPLAHHTYLYYLYIPWAGGALAVAGLAQEFLISWPPRRALLLGVIALGLYVAIEARNIHVRQTAKRDALPVDRTMRDAVLLRHALPALREASLPRGTRVAFVNPAPRGRFDLTTGTQTRPEDVPSRVSYFPLEAAMRGGETLRLFTPGLDYLGFTTTIPPRWEDAECFYYEQRGWLRRWGRGQQALMRQAEVQMTSGQWAAADSTLIRVRSLGDTLPSALQWQISVLAKSARYREANLLAKEFVARWPKHPFAARADSLGSSLHAVQ